MSLILHIETSTKVCSVALSENGKVIAVEESNDENYSHGEKLTSFISQVVQSAAVLLSDLAAISVTSGPGSYTGLRIGVSTAKGLCYALNIPLISINSLLNLAYVAKVNHSTTNICAMIDARRMEVYSAIFDWELNELKPISADILDVNSYSAYEPFVSVGDGVQKTESLWQERNIRMDEAIFSSAIGHSEYAYKCFLESKFEDVAYFEPYYLKDFVSNQVKKHS